MKFVHKHICLSLALSNSICLQKNDDRPSRGMKWWTFMTHADTCRYECPAHPLNNCQGLCCEKRLRCCHLSPEPEMETGTAKQPAGCICYASLTYTHRAWITLYLPYSPPVAAFYMCSMLSTTDLDCLHFVPSKSYQRLEDCCSGASKTSYSNC